MFLDVNVMLEWYGIFIHVQNSGPARAFWLEVLSKYFEVWII